MDKGTRKIQLGNDDLNELRLMDKEMQNVRLKIENARLALESFGKDEMISAGQRAQLEKRIEEKYDFKFQLSQIQLETGEVNVIAEAPKSNKLDEAMKKITDIFKGKEKEITPATDEMKVKEG